MTPVSKIKKNSLSIRLTESAVFLRSDYTHSRRINDSSRSSRDSLLRGLLVLDLAKPTRITNIEAQLTAVAAIYCPEGIGARRLEVIDQPHVFHTSTILFRSSAPGSYPQKTLPGITSAPYRRSASIGPGVSYTQSLDQDTTVSRLWDHNESDDVSWEEGSTTTDHQTWRSTPSPNTSVPPHDVSNLGRNRRLSMDRNPLSPPLLSITPPAPPYSLPVPADEHLSTRPTTPGLRRPSFTEAILEDESDPPRSTDRQTNITPSTDTSGSSNPHREYLSRDSRPTNSTPSLDQQRGRLPSRTSAAKRFSLSAVPSILLGAVGSVSPRRGLFPPKNDNEMESQRERSIGSSVNLISGRLERGRTTERSESTGDSTLEDDESSNSRVRGRKEEKERTSVLAKLLGGEREEWSQEFKPGTYTYPITFSIPSSAPPTMQVDYGSISWKLRAFAHRPGTFHPKLSVECDVIVVACPTEEDTEDSESIIIERNWDQQMQYLISISGRAFFIGGTIPISILLMPMDKVKVHRITVYIEEKVDYFSRFHTLIRSDPPVRTTLLSLQNEGKNSIPILPLESSGSDVLRSSPLLELLDPEERRDTSKMSELAANFMGPGPWSFHKDLKLPNSCRLIKFSNKNLQANVRIGHLLKVILRLEKAPLPSEEDSHKAKPALFDIVVQTPILILSCRCNPEWASLPRYTEDFKDMMHDITPTCPCQARQQSLSPSPQSSTDSLAPATRKSTASLTPPRANGNDSRQPQSPHSEYTETMIRSSSLFERLVSGQESETGEAPPAYDFFDDGAGGRGRSAISVAVREVPPNVVKSGIFT